MQSLKTLTPLALLVASVSACTTVPTRDRDAAAPDASSGVDAAPADDVTSAPDATGDTGAIVDTGVSADSGAIVDTGVATDTGVLVDSGACVAPTRACGGRCVNSTNDPLHCGACDNRCLGGANAVAECAASTCSLRCTAGFGNCDSNPTNGCEALLNTAANCGACGIRCTGSTPVCDAAQGRCVSICTAGLTLCGGTCVDTTTSPSHCGSCGNMCPAPANSVAVCAAGTCGSICSSGFGNCDALASNGCEVNTNTSTAHCGRCGNPCPARANATTTCASGTCGFTCNTGFGDCDGNAANGCETSLTRDPLNCGRCGTNCGPNGACTGGGPMPTCVSCANTSCGSFCANLTNDVANCGACGYRCGAAPAGYTATCASGFCRYGFACDPAYADCNRMPGDGYEVNIDTSATNCGACGVACGLSSRCCNGACRLNTLSCIPCA